ncbi:MAG TPA: Flp family type IVb pilin [Clostridiales bacterium]|nr:Flp family type IVb pilin [Clostridiales bacterium]
MKDMLMRLVREEGGQALTEYGLIIGLIAVVVIVALSTLGGKLNGFFETINDELENAADTN